MGIGYAFADAIGHTAYLLGRTSRASIEANLRQAMGGDTDDATIRRTSRKAFKSLSRNYYDLLRVPRLSPERLAGKVKVVGLGNLEKAREHGRGAITATAHLGNVDLVPQAAVALSIPLTILVEIFEPQQLWEHWMKIRAGLGLKFVPANARGLKAAYKALSRGEVVGIACDRTVHGRGIETTFMGAPAIMPVGAAELALRTGASLVPIFCLRDGYDRYKICIEPAIAVPTHGDKGYTSEDVRFLVDEMIGVMERYIRQYLEQWMLFQPLWARNGT